MRAAIDARAFTWMVGLCVIWGIQQVMVKAVAADMSPVMQIALRSGVAAVILMVMLWQRGISPVTAETWRPGLFAGLLFAIEFLLIAEGLRFTSASHMVVFLYSTPIFVALGLHWRFPAERLNTLQWLGILSAFFGIALAFLSGDGTAVSAEAPNPVLGDILALLAALAWAATTVLIRSTSLSQSPATQTLWYQLSVCFALLLAYAWLTDQAAWRATPEVLGNLLFQCLGVALGSLLAWFWLLRQYPASQLGVFTFMTPLFGVLFGVWLLDEPLEQSFATGAVLVMLGLILVNGHAKIRQHLRLDFRRG